jgi:hypothetical protein
VQRKLIAELVEEACAAGFRCGLVGFHVRRLTDGTMSAFHPVAPIPVAPAKDRNRHEGLFRSSVRCRLGERTLANAQIRPGCADSGLRGVPTKVPGLTKPDLREGEQNAWATPFDRFLSPRARGRGG